jgi:hypothetical protein
MALSAIGAVPLGGQAFTPAYTGRYFDGAAFTEQVRTSGESHTGAADRKWATNRVARYTMSRRGDTLMVSADSLQLLETVDGVQRPVDVDAVIGARWKLLPTIGGYFRAVDQPFVPEAVAEVSDMAVAMDDFLPHRPPRFRPGQRELDAGNRHWRRLSDSAGHQRFQWTEVSRRDSSYRAGDSVTVDADFVERHLGELSRSADLSRYVL